jgi:hypothetical protein
VLWITPLEYVKLLRECNGKNVNLTSPVQPMVNADLTIVSCSQKREGLLAVSMHCLTILQHESDQSAQIRPWCFFFLPSTNPGQSNGSD